MKIFFLPQAILVLAQVDFVIGTMLPPSEEKKAKGFIGYSMENYKENFWSDYSVDDRTGVHAIKLFRHCRWGL